MNRDADGEKKSGENFLLKLTKNRHQEHKAAISWVLEKFGKKSAGDLELLSTIVFADQEAAERQEHVSHKELARKVKEIKPKFAQAYILQAIKKLEARGVLKGD
jgi:hypothetical protein